MALLGDSKEQCFKKYLIEISQKPHLEHADFRECALTAEDFVMIRHLLTDHPSITTVDFSGNQLDAISVGIVCDMLRDNSRIVDVNVEDTGLSTGMMYKIDVALEKNIDKLEAKSERRDRLARLRIVREAEAQHAQAVQGLLDAESQERGATASDEQSEWRAMQLNSKKYIQKLIRDDQCGKILRQHETERQHLENEEQTDREFVASIENREIRDVFECGVVLVHVKTAQAETREMEQLRRHERGEWILATRRRRQRLRAQADERYAIEDAEVVARRGIVVQERVSVPTLRDVMTQQGTDAPDGRDVRKARGEAQRVEQSNERKHVEREALAAKTAFSSLVWSLFQTVEDAIHAINACTFELSAIATAQKELDALLSEEPLLSLSGPSDGTSEDSLSSLPICFASTFRPVKICPDTRIKLEMRDGWKDEANKALVTMEAHCDRLEISRHQSLQLLGGAIADLLNDSQLTPRQAHFQGVEDPEELFSCATAAARAYKTLLQAVEPTLCVPVHAPFIDVEALAVEKTSVVSGRLTVSMHPEPRPTDHLIPPAASKPPGDRGPRVQVDIPGETLAFSLCATAPTVQLQHALARHQMAFVDETTLEDVIGIELDDAQPPWEPRLAPSHLVHQSFDASGTDPLVDIAAFLRSLRYYSSEDNLGTPVIRHISIRASIEISGASLDGTSASIAEGAPLQLGLPSKFQLLSAAVHVVVANPYLSVDRGFLVTKFVEGTAPEAHPLLHRFHVAATPSISQTTEAPLDGSTKDNVCACGSQPIEVLPAPCDFSFHGFRLGISFLSGHDAHDQILLSPPTYGFCRVVPGDDANESAPPIVIVNPSGFKEIPIGFVSKGKLLTCSEATRQRAREERQGPIEISLSSEICGAAHLRRFLGSLRFCSTAIGPRMGPRCVEISLTDAAGRRSVTPVVIDVVALNAIQITRSLAESERLPVCTVRLMTPAAPQWTTRSFPFYDAQLATTEESVTSAHLEYSAQFADAPQEGGDDATLQGLNLAFTIPADSADAAKSIDPSGQRVTVDLPGRTTIVALGKLLQESSVAFTLAGLTADRSVTVRVGLRATLRNGTIVDCGTATILQLRRPAPDCRHTQCTQGIFVRGAPQRVLAGHCRFPVRDCDRTHRVSMRIDLVDGAAPGDEVTLLVPRRSLDAPTPLALVVSGDHRNIHWNGARVGSVRIVSDSNIGASGLHCILDSFDVISGYEQANELLDHVSCNLTSCGRRVIRATALVESALNPAEWSQIDLFREFRCLETDVTSITVVSLTRQLSAFFSASPGIQEDCCCDVPPVPLLPFGSVCVRSAEYYDGGRLVIELGTTSRHALALLSPALQSFHANSLGLDDPTSVLKLFNLMLDPESHKLTCDIHGTIKTIGRLSKRSATAWTVDFDVHSPPVCTPNVVEYVISCIGIVVDPKATFLDSSSVSSCYFYLTEPTNRLGAAFVLDVVFAPPLVAVQCDLGGSQEDHDLDRTCVMSDTNAGAPHHRALLYRWAWQLAPSRPQITSSLKLVFCPADEFEVQLRSESYRQEGSGAIIGPSGAVVPGIEFGMLGVSVEITEETTRSILFQYEEILSALVVIPSCTVNCSLRPPALSLLITSSDGTAEVQFFAS